MPDPRQEMARRILEERRSMAQQILAERRGEAEPAPAKVIQMPVQHIEGQAPETPTPSGPKAQFNETLNLVTASAYPHLYGAANAGLDWIQDRVGPGVVSDFVQDQQRASLGRGQAIDSSPADALEGQGSAAYREAMRRQIAQGRAQQPADARMGMAGGVAVMGPALAGRSIAGTAARAGAYGSASGFAESDGDVGTALTRGVRDAGTTAVFGGLGKLAARLQAERAAKAAQEAERAAAPAPPIMDSLRQGARKTAEAIGTRVLPAAGTAYAAKMLGAPNLVPGIMAAAVAPHILRGAKTAGAAALAGTNPATLDAAGRMAVGMLEGSDAPGPHGYDQRATGAALPSMASSAKAQPPAGRMEVEIGEARQLPQVEIGEARLLPQVEIGEAREIPSRYDTRAMAVVKQRRANEQRRAGIDRLRQAFVNQTMTEPLRQFVGSTIEEGADYKRMAAKLEEAQADPKLAAELTKLLGAGGGK